MELVATIALNAAGVVILLAFGAFGVLSLAEAQRRAAGVSFLVAVLGGGIFFGAALLPGGGPTAVLGVTAGVTLLALVLPALPIGRFEIGHDVPSRRVDERDIMFARARLESGTPEFEAYYAMRPENRESDDRTRSQPGLLSPEARHGDPILFAAPVGSFTLTEAIRESVDGSVAPDRQALPPARATDFIKSLARYYGALDVGITELKPYHVYSHVGRGTGAFGEPIPVEHRMAVAFTVEMDYRMIGANPTAPGLMESARQYVEAARVAVPLAAAIRHLGYPARAHIDGNYRVIAPLVARDAGLGEIGRMGLLMTPRLGPRVRLGLVTTDLELTPDRRPRDPSILDFCTLCKKCAENCPSRSIPFESRREIDGALRWRINADTCFRYWNLVGTDCGVCMTVCPYSHPDNLAHGLVRRAIKRSGLFRRAALRLDDVFYGKKPAPRPAPPWTRVQPVRRPPSRAGDAG